jgi:hypothetical protein
MNDIILRCLRGHEWSAFVTRHAATRSMPEERAVAASDERCDECGLWGYGPGEDPDYDELTKELRFCGICERVWDTKTGRPAKFDLEPEVETCPKCRVEKGVAA